jgi:hypothetical protein
MENIIGFLIFILLLGWGIYWFHVGRFKLARFNVFVGIICILFLAFYGFDHLKEIDLKLDVQVFWT